MNIINKVHCTHQKEKKDKKRKSGEELRQGKILDVGAYVKAMEGSCLLASTHGLLNQEIF